MNSKIENKLKMMKVVISVCDSQPQAMGSIPALESAYAAFKNKVAALEEVINNQIGELKGITLEKQRLKQELGSLGTAVSRALLAFANAEGNVQLETEMNYSPSCLIRERDEALLKISENIRNKGLEHLNVLAAYGVDQNMLDKMGTAINGYNSLCPAPREARSRRKADTRMLDQLSDEAMLLLLKQVDRLMVLLADEHNNFREVYRNARNIIAYKGRNRNGISPGGYGALEGCVTAGYDGSPVEDALVMIEGLELTAETDEEGEFYFEQLPAGSYTLRVMAETYRDAVVSDAEIMDGTATEVDVVMSAETE